MMRWTTIAGVDAARVVNRRAAADWRTGACRSACRDSPNYDAESPASKLPRRCRHEYDAVTVAEYRTQRFARTAGAPCY